MQPRLPFWFLQRQGKIEPTGPDRYRVTAPNLGEAWIGVRRDEAGRWFPFFSTTLEGPEQANLPEGLPTEADAWEAAFELYRTQLVV